MDYTASVIIAVIVASIVGFAVSLYVAWLLLIKTFLDRIMFVKGIIQILPLDLIFLEEERQHHHKRSRKSG